MNYFATKFFVLFWRNPIHVDLSSFSLCCPDSPATNEIPDRSRMHTACLNKITVEYLSRPKILPASSRQSAV